MGYGKMKNCLIKGKIKQYQTKKQNEDIYYGTKVRDYSVKYEETVKI